MSRWIAALIVFLLAFVVIGYRAGAAPDTLFDETVYTTAALNLGDTGRLTWKGEPVFVHPPLYFFTQASWLTLVGRSDADLYTAIASARVLTSLFGAVAVCLLFLFAMELFARASPRRRLALSAATALIAMFDPILVRYSRLAMIDSMALAIGMLALYLAWTLFGAHRFRYVMVIGLVGGIAMLVKEIVIFLLVVPLIYALLRHDRPLARRAAAAVGISVLLWSSFPIWAVSLGLGPRFVEQKFLTFQRLLGLLQITGWNRPGVSFVSAVQSSARDYASSYLVLAGGFVVLLWLWVRRTGTRATFLLAWLGSMYAFGAYTVSRGQLNEQFFIYLMPSSVLATVVGADAVAGAIAARRASRAGRSRWRLVALGLALAIAALGALNWTRLYSRGTDAGIRQMGEFARVTFPTCSVFNASGDVQKYAYGLEGRGVTEYASGPRAIAHGVRYFFLNRKDIAARYGVMSPDLADWIQTNGTRVAAFPSRTHLSVELWRVADRRFDPATDVLEVPHGNFINVEGSACGGFYVVDEPGALMHSGAQAFGGKGVLGRPISDTFTSEGRTLQAFDTAVLASAGARAAEPWPVISILSARAPEIMRVENLPVGATPFPAGPASAAALNDPGIAAYYLGVDPALADAGTWRAAAARWGRPMGRAARMPDGIIRQSFENVVLQRVPDTETVRPAGIGAALTRAGLVPASARALNPVPGLQLRPNFAPLPNDGRGFLVAFVILLGVWAIAMVVGMRRRHTRVPRGARTRVAVDARVITDRYHGIGRQAYEVVEAMVASRRVDVVLLVGKEPDGRLSARGLAREPNVRLVEFGAPLVSVSEKLRWPSALRRARCDVLFTPYHVAGPLFSRVPVVTIVHDCILETSSSFAPANAKMSAYRSITRRVLKRAAAVVTPSNVTRADVKRIYGRDIPPEAVLPHAVGKKFSDQGAAVRARAALNLPERYLVHVGVRRPHKNQAVLVHALARARVRHPDLHLVLVGAEDPRFEDPLPALIDELELRDAVVLLPDVPEELLPGVYQGAVALTYPSLMEGFGLPVLEAMAAGVPVIAADIPVLVEVTRGAALLVSPRDPQAWAAAIDRIMSNPILAQACRSQGLEVARSRTWGSVAERLVGVIEGVVRGDVAEGADARPARAREGDGPLAIGRVERADRKMVRARVAVVLLALVLSLVGVYSRGSTSAQASRELRALPGADWVVEDRILRSGQPDDEDLLDMRDLLKVRAVVDLLPSGTLEGAVVRDLEMQFLHVHLKEGAAPSIDQLRVLTEFLRANRRRGVILVHDRSGYDRAPTVEAMLWMLRGMSTTDAIARATESVPDDVTPFSEAQLDAINRLAAALGTRGIPGRPQPPGAPPARIDRQAFGW